MPMNNLSSIISDDEKIDLDLVNGGKRTIPHILCTQQNHIRKTSKQRNKSLGAKFNCGTPHVAYSIYLYRTGFSQICALSTISLAACNYQIT